jgi:hypothetical protein
VSMAEQLHARMTAAARRESRDALDNVQGRPEVPRIEQYKFTVKFDQPVTRGLRQYALDNETSIAEIVRAAMDEFLAGDAVVAEAVERRLRQRKADRRGVTES